MQRAPTASLWIVLSLSPLLAAAAVDRPVDQAVETITARDLRSNVYFLAADEMQGREIGTPFNDLATLYLAHRFELLGLQPPGEAGFFQHFELAKSTLSEPNRLEIRRGERLLSSGSLKENFFPSPLSASGRVTAPLVFAGYGISAPRHRYDDYELVDVRGKIVVVMAHEPGENNAESPFDGLLDSEFSDEFSKIMTAQARGASGMIIIPDEGNHPQDLSFSRQVGATWPENPSREKLHLEIRTRRVGIPVAQASSQLAPALLNLQAEALGQLQEEIDEAGRPRSFPVKDRVVTLETSLSRERLPARNVLAYLPGSDGSLSREVVIIGAHLDHVGSHEGEIFNGADDDASGIAGLLEIAEAYALSAQRPRRSILFAAWNAEEQGLLGSRYYVQSPLFPLEKTAAVFQMDMIGRNEEVPDPSHPRFRGLPRQSAEANRNSVNILGYSRSEALRRLVVQTNPLVRLDLRFRYDNNPSNLLRRSDNWPFLVQGVPALFFHTGLHPDYHQPSDTAEKLNYAKMERIVRLIFLCSWSAASAPRTALLDPPAGP